MQLFRSEEHARRAGAGERRDVLTLRQAVALAHAWYARKLQPDWHRHTADDAETLFRSLGFDMDFWRLR